MTYINQQSLVWLRDIEMCFQSPRTECTLALASAQTSLLNMWIHIYICQCPNIYTICHRQTYNDEVAMMKYFFRPNGKTTIQNIETDKKRKQALTSTGRFWEPCMLLLIMWNIAGIVEQGTTFHQLKMYLTIYSVSLKNGKQDLKEMSVYPCS